MASEFDQARTFFLDGVARFEAGDFAGAERLFLAALALVPGRPSVLTNLGAARLKLGRLEEAEADLAQALRQEPNNAEALGHYGSVLAQQLRLPDALGAFNRALAVQPRSPTLWLLRGTVLKELKDDDAAATSFRESLAYGGDPEINGFYLAGLGATQPPPAAPRSYVQALFDNYAGDFERHLVDGLQYRAPALLCEPFGKRRFGHGLDLGCGTGLCGPHMRPLADRLTGVDLSAGMLAQAARLGCYDALVQADALEFLGSQRAFDFVVMADVLIYLGALAPVFAALQRVVPPAGVVAFTVKEATTTDLELRSSLRYAHSGASIRETAAACGFRVLAIAPGPLREDQGRPVAGLYAWLERA